MTTCMILTLAIGGSAVLLAFIKLIAVMYLAGATQ